MIGRAPSNSLRRRMTAHKRRHMTKGQRAMIAGVERDFTEFFGQALEVSSCEASDSLKRGEPISLFSLSLQTAMIRESSG